MSSSKDFLDFVLDQLSGLPDISWRADASTVYLFSNGGFAPCHITAKTKTTRKGGLCFWWEYACTNQVENKQLFAEFMQRVKEFKEKWLISPRGEKFD